MNKSGLCYLPRSLWGQPSSGEQVETILIRHEEYEIKGMGLWKESGQAGRVNQSWSSCTDWKKRGPK